MPICLRSWLYHRSNYCLCGQRIERTLFLRSRRLRVRVTCFCVSQKHRVDMRPTTDVRLTRDTSSVQCLQSSDKSHILVASELSQMVNLLHSKLSRAENSLVLMFQMRCQAGRRSILICDALLLTPAVGASHERVVAQQTQHSKKYVRNSLPKANAHAFPLSVVWWMWSRRLWLCTSSQ